MGRFWRNIPNKKPSKLSGGEGQRVAIARAMVKEPKIVLADEPTANLDATNAHAIIQTMKKLNEELGTTFLFSTHDEKVMQYLNRIIHLKGGEVEKDEIITATKSAIMKLAFQLAYRNLVGAGLRTWLNVGHFSFHFHCHYIF